MVVLFYTHTPRFTFTEFLNDCDAQFRLASSLVDDHLDELQPVMPQW